MSIIPFLVTLLRELLPFLKEALLEGQSFKVWLKSNWHTFACLVTTLLLTFIIAFLAESLIIANEHLARSQQVVDNVKAPLTIFAERYGTMQADNKELQQTIAQLQSVNAEQKTKLGQYEEWMGACGVNLSTGQCRVVQQPKPIKPPARTKRKPKPQTTPAAEIVTPPVEPKPRFFQRLRKLLSRDNDDKETP